MQVEGTPVYRARDVATMVDVDVSTIYRAIRSGELRAYRVGKLLRIPASAIEAYLTRPTATSTTITDQDLVVESTFSPVNEGSEGNGNA
jgi:excisionase family DNA binding protein